MTAGPAEPAPSFRGVIALIEQRCTACMLCVRECPDWCIHIEGHPEPVAGAPGGRERTRTALDRFAIDYSLCMYCGICVEVCPFDALEWRPDYRYAAAAAPDLVQERDRLEAWWPGPEPPG